MSRSRIRSKRMNRGRNQSTHLSTSWRRTRGRNKSRNSRVNKCRNECLAPLFQRKREQQFVCLCGSSNSSHFARPSERHSRQRRFVTRRYSTTALQSIFVSLAALWQPQFTISSRMRLGAELLLIRMCRRIEAITWRRLGKASRSELLCCFGRFECALRKY